MTANGTHREPSPAHTLVLYDGVCGLCNRLVKFLLRRDLADCFRFAPLQSEFSRTVLERHGLNSGDLETVVVIDNFGTSGEQAFTRSDAAIASVSRLGGMWKAASVARFVPRVLREPVYKLIARLRYRIFGRYDACLMPAPEFRKKFLS